MKSGGASSQPASPGNSAISEDLVRVEVGRNASVCVDGREWRRKDEEDKETGSDESSEKLYEVAPSRKRRRGEGGAMSVDGGRRNVEEENWVVKTGQWRLRVQNGRNGKGRVECVLVAVKLDCVRCELGRNTQKGFLV